MRWHLLLQLCRLGTFPGRFDSQKAVSVEAVACKQLVSGMWNRRISQSGAEGGCTSQAPELDWDQQTLDASHPCWHLKAFQIMKQWNMALNTSPCARGRVLVVIITGSMFLNHRYDITQTMVSVCSPSHTEAAECVIAHNDFSSMPIAPETGAKNASCVSQRPTRPIMTWSLPGTHLCHA